MASIQGIYVALFGRPADPAGLAFFNEATNDGADLTAIGDLASTSEYLSRFTGMTNEEIINSIYQSLFERDGEPAGIAFYVAELEAGRLNINNIAIAILDGAQGDDLLTVNAKIAAADIFTSHLDLDVELEAYNGTAAAQIGREFLDTVTKDDAGTEAEADAAILRLLSDGGQQPGGGGGGGSGPDTVAPIGIINPSSAGDHTFKAGEKITFTVDFSENVNVPATLQLVLSNGDVADYEGGSGSSHVTFSYTVPSGANVADLEVTGVTGVGDIKDAADNIGSITTPTTSLDIVLDSTPPVGVITFAGDGTYGAGETIEFTVTFGEVVDVAAGTTLTLTGGREASYVSGDGTDVLKFAYTVLSSESAPDVEVTGVNGSIADKAGNAADIVATTSLDIVLIPPDGEVHVYDDAGDLVGIYSTQADPDPASGPPWFQNAKPINAAVNSSHDNYTVLVGAGNYTTTGTPIDITQNGLKLLGAQFDVDPRSAAGLRTSGSSDESIINGNGGTQVVRIHANDVEVNGFEIYGASQDAVTTTNALSEGGKQGANISYNIVRNASDDGIVLYKHTGGTVDHNLIYQVADGINVAGNDSISGVPVSSDNNVKYNEIANSSGNGGIYVYDSVNTIIEENYVHDYSGDSGIVVGLRRGTGNPQQDGGTVKNNIVDTTGENGIDIFQSDVTISGNTIKNVPGWAISVGIDYNNESRGNPKPDNVDVTDNVIINVNNTKSSPVGPFRVADGSTDIVFTGNHISGGPGTDALNGTTGADIFVVLNLLDGTDTISGFSNGSDKLDLRAIGFDFDAADTNNDNVIGAGDSNVSVASGTITWTLSPSATLILTGVAELASSDFV